MIPNLSCLAKEQSSVHHWWGPGLGFIASIPLLQGYQAPMHMDQLLVTSDDGSQSLSRTAPALSRVIAGCPRDLPSLRAPLQTAAAAIGGPQKYCEPVL